MTTDERLAVEVTTGSIPEYILFTVMVGGTARKDFIRELNAIIKTLEEGE